ncbi:cysteine desulfurase-like protein [Nonomuraea soli]|uniref:Cysteine desulfurase family protein (TIGR01976 family) n=1 Tax=Nonomuraea soli TaxID=1032476 RepID=A0A7W0HUQ7_9ACTN|nr:cysteine desulfurase-like protein [Nonomuraea soli]MBA2896439.1 cysteine desulfurase family protein (TIGR01976 family) [Nonomuraea soli]
MFPLDAVRAAYPALSDGYAYLDGAAGTQTPVSVIEAISAAYRAGIGNVGGAFPASHRSGRIVEQARAAVADLVGGSAEGVVFGPNMTTLTYRLAAALRLGPDDEIVLSRLDHDANVRPWVQTGATVRWAEVDPVTGELPVEQYRELVGPRTRLVAVTAASNVLGTRPEVAEIAAIARRAGALVFVDGVHATPHGPVDMAELGADFYVTSAYKWSGPHIGALVADPGLLATIFPDKLTPAPDTVPDRFETGTAAFADLAGVTAAVEHLAGLAWMGADDAEGAAGPVGPVGTPEPTGPSGPSRRRRLLASMAAAEAHELELFAELVDGLAAMPHVTLYGKPARRTATAYFTVSGLSPREVAEQLARRRVNVWSGHNYAWELTGALGVRDGGGAVRAGLVHYNSRDDVQRLLDGVAELRSSPPARP